MICFVSFGILRDFSICLLMQIFWSPGRKNMDQMGNNTVAEGFLFYVADSWKKETSWGSAGTWPSVSSRLSWVAGSHEGRAWSVSTVTQLPPPPLWRRWPLLNSLAGVWTAPLSWDALSCARHQRGLGGSQWTYFREISKNLKAFMCLHKEGCFQWLVLTEPVK